MRREALRRQVMLVPRPAVHGCLRAFQHWQKRLRERQLSTAAGGRALQTRQALVEARPVGMAQTHSSRDT